MREDYAEYTPCPRCNTALLYCNCNCPKCGKRKGCNCKLQPLTMTLDY